MSTSKNKHVLVDIETLGNGSYAPILSIGAVEFDPFNIRQTENEFYLTIEMSSALTIGAPDGSTIAWWFQQSDAVRKSILAPNAVDIYEALMEFYEWYARGKFTHFWCYGANFDAVIIDNAYRSIKMKAPYLYRDVRCVRTLLDLAGIGKTTTGGIEHHALDDAKRHAGDVQTAYAQLHLGGQ